MDAQVGTTTMASAQVLTASYVLQEDELQTVQGASTKWLQLYGETQTVLEITYTTGAGETNNYVEFYIEYGTGAPASIAWHRETMEYLDDSADQIVLEEWTYKLDGASAATAYTKRIQLPVCTKGIRIYAKEVGRASNFGTLTIRANTQSAGAVAYNRSLQTVTLETGSITLSENIAKVGGVAVSAKDAPAAEVPLLGGYEFEVLGSLNTDGDTAGDKVPLKGTADGILYVQQTDGISTPGILARTSGTEQPAVTDDALIVHDTGTLLPIFDSTHKSPQDFQVAYTSSTTVTCTGQNFTLTDGIAEVAYILYKPTGGTWQAPLINGKNGVSIIGSAGVLTVAGAGTPFASADAYIVGVNYQEKAYNAPTDSSQVTELRPLWTRLTPDTPVDVTDETDGTNNYYVSMAGYRRLDLQWVISGGSGTMTLSFEGSVQDEGVADGSKVYIDVSTDAYGAANSQATDYLIDDANFFGGFTTVKLKTISSTGSADDADITLYAKRSY